MSMFSKRYASTFAKRFENEVRSTVKIQSAHREGGTTFDKNFPKYEKKQAKPWEGRNMTKDEFYQKKYSFIGEKRRSQLDEKVERQRRYRENRRDTESTQRQDNRGYTEKLRIPKNPLSEYIYGNHSVLSALSANKRQSFNTLYVQNIKTCLPPIIKLARQFNLKIQDNVGKDVLNSLSGFGVHNGIVLETKPLELPTIKALGPSNGEEGSYKLALSNDLYNTVTEQEKEVARKAPTDEETSQIVSSTRYPLGIYLDGLMDPRNVGAIVRSAFFFGVDFVVVPDSESAKLGPVASRASAGALEVLNVYKTSESLAFLEKSSNNGWTIVSTAASVPKGDKDAISAKNIKPDDLAGLCERSPVLLVTGSEGLGVRTNILKKSDFIVGIAQHRESGSGLVDSLNASVATALLISKCVN